MAGNSTDRRRRPAFTLVELLVVIAIIGVLVALLLPAVQAAREAGRRTTCINKVRQMVLASHNYHDSNREFPAGAQVNDGPGASGALSWLVQILPYIEQAGISQQLGDSINVGDIEATNQRLLELQLDLYWCPSRPFDDEDFTSTGYAISTYFGVTGGPIFDGSDNEVQVDDVDFYDLEDSHCGDLYTNGVFIPYNPVSMREISDGTSNTFAVGERTWQLRSFFAGAFYEGGRSHEKASKICSHSQKNMAIGISTPEESGYYVFEQKPPPNARKVVRFNDFFFGSEHPGGTHFAFADGSAKFISDDNDLRVLQALATRNGSETSSLGQ